MLLLKSNVVAVSPANCLWKIGRPSCLRSNAVLRSSLVPLYNPVSDLISTLFRSKLVGALTSAS